MTIEELREVLSELAGGRLALELDDGRELAGVLVDVLDDVATIDVDTEEAEPTRERIELSRISDVALSTLSEGPE